MQFDSVRRLAGLQLENSASAVRCSVALARVSFSQPAKGLDCKVEPRRANRGRSLAGADPPV
jgi:hypothetical protein